MDDLRLIYLDSLGLDVLTERRDRPRREGSTDGDRAAALEDLHTSLVDCHRCPLGDTRTNLVFGTGDPHARLVFVGEAPGRDEDLKGEPFVGKAGQLLTKIIAAMGLTRKDVYICNVNKCRPPGNRDPHPSEVEACQPFLLRQLEIISPKVICALGGFAAKALLDSDARISQVRGTFHTYNGIPLMPTYHPSFLLRNPNAKREVWDDMKKIMEYLDLPIPNGRA